jgi:HK97 family phage major capsid protein
MNHRNRARQRAQGFSTTPAAEPVPAPQAGVRSDATKEDDAYATISIMGDIGWDVTAEDVAAAVAGAKDKPLMVNVFSYGGDALQGLAIYQILTAHNAEVTTKVLGVAASAGSVIAMAGDKRIVPTNGAVMIHNPWTFTMGDADEHRKSANMLDGLKAAYVHTYSAATGLSADEIEPYLAEERWLYGEEALALGFATETAEPMTAFASIAPPPADRFRQMPDDLKAMAGITDKAKGGVVKGGQVASLGDDAREAFVPLAEIPARIPVLAPAPAPEPVGTAPALANVPSLANDNPALGQTIAALSMTVATTDNQEAGVLAERDRVKAIRGMAKMHNLPGDFVDHLIDNAPDVASAREQVLDKIATRHDATVGAIADAGHGSLGMSKSELKAYNLMNVVRYLADPKASTRDAAGYELEVSQAAEPYHGRSARGVIVPHEVLAQRPQAAATGTLAAGGALVGTDRLDGSFVDFIRQRSAFISSGVTVLNGLQGNVEIGRQTGKSTYFFVGEDVNVAASDLTFGLINMTPKTIGVRVPVSRRLMIQSSPDIDTLVRNDIINETALGVDYSVGYGTGSNSQPLGLARTTGIGSVTLGGGTDISNFTAQQGGAGTHNSGDWADYVALETAIANANLDVGSMRMVMNSAMRGANKTTLRATSAGSDYIMTDAGTINGYPVTISNQIQFNDVFFGTWSEHLVGFWSGVDLVVDPFTQSASGQVIMTAYQDFDSAVRRPGSFALAS